MKLNFNNASFDVEHISYDVDDSGVPVDIFISADKTTCDSIAEFAHIGYNYSDEFHCGLFARLDKFCVS